MVLEGAGKMTKYDEHDHLQKEFGYVRFGVGSWTPGGDLIVSYNRF